MAAKRNDELSELLIEAGFSNTYNSLWLAPDTEAMEVKEMPDAETPVIFNIQQTGYYR